MANRRRKKDDKSTLQRPVAQLPEDYPELLDDLKARIRTAQVKAALSVNRELIELYWSIGESIVQRQQAEGWGNSVIERLSADLRREFPHMSGFSAANIWRMRAFYLAWTEASLAQPVREVGANQNLSQLVRELAGKSLPQPVARIPWGTNIALLEKIKDALPTAEALENELRKVEGEA